MTSYEWEPVDRNNEPYGVHLTIKVLETSIGTFIAIPSHLAKIPNLATPYKSYEGMHTIEDAVEMCIRQFKMYQAAASETQWIENDDF